MIKAANERALGDTGHTAVAAELPHQRDTTLRVLMAELLDTAERVLAAWKALQAEQGDAERASDIVADLDVKVFVLGRKCDSVTSQLDALNELLPAEQNEPAT